MTTLREVQGSRAGVSWRPRPLTALGLRIGALLAPLVAAVLVALVLTHQAPDDLSRGALWLWRAMVIAAGTATSLLVERHLLRRVVSLSTLMKLSLVFPDRAPTRYSVALRTRTPTQLKHDVEAHGVPADTQAAAELLLELVAALNVHDRLTRGHSERVRAYARLIGDELGLRAEEIERLNWASLLHDIGKLEVSAATLAEPGRLSDEQWVEIKRHPEAGARLAEPLRGWLGPWWDAIHDHHERWEGGGYPSGAAGTDISLAGRIVAVADAFDVMTSARSYKPPRSAAAAREELQRCAGSQFDPEVVRAFLNISVGRLRLLIGPLSWLTQVPVLGRVPVTTVAGNAVAALATTAFVAFTPGPEPSPAPPAAARAPTEVVDGPSLEDRATEVDPTTERRGPTRGPALSLSASAPAASTPTASEPTPRRVPNPTPNDPTPPAVPVPEPLADATVSVGTGGVSVDLRGQEPVEAPIGDGNGDDDTTITVEVDVPGI